MKTITLNQFKEILNYLLDNNKQLVEQGQTPIAVGISGNAGIGKTAVVQQVANDRNMTLCKLNLSQLEEIGDLCGYPVKEYKIVNGDDVSWVPADILHTIQCQDCVITGEHRMGYAPPAWLPREENPNGTILFLDDFTRANVLFLQAIMELINCGTYMTWSLPKNTTICLSENPDNGDFQVNTMDVAMRTRYVSFNVDFDLDEWARWAEFANIETRAINFALMYGHEIFNNDNKQVINPRSYVTFCKAISGIKNWNDPNSLALILQISKGCFNEEDNVIGNLFTMFINNNLDKLISPKDILMKKWDDVASEIKSVVYVNGNYRQDIASILATRLLNYSSKYLEATGNKLDVVQDRLLDFIDHDVKLFTDDLIFNIIKMLIKNYPGKTNKLLMNGKIRSKLI